MGFALPIDPTPTAVESLAARLRASERAQLDWFPAAFRRDVVSPLASADPDNLVEVVEDVAVVAVRLFFKLAASTARLLQTSDATAVLELPLDPVHQRIVERLEAVDRMACDDLREAVEWLRAILQALMIDHRMEVALTSAPGLGEAEPSEQAIRDELRSMGGSFLRGLVLTAAAVEALHSETSIPLAMRRWSEMALRDVQAAANALRADGVAVPTAVRVPGMDPVEWRHRRRRGLIRINALPPGVMEWIVSDLRPDEVWLFGSRGRGTHAPTSDWDVLVVVRDDADQELAERVAASNAFLRRHRVDLVVATRAQFDANRASPGTFIHEVVQHGQRLHAR